MKEKGFTLIELLAVIVILAIIALIATPIILGIIRDAKEQANERSIDMYAKSIKNALLNYELKENKQTTSFEDIEQYIEYDGNVVCDIIQIYEDGNIYLNGCIVNSEEVKYSYGNQKFKTYNNGEEVYFDVERGVSCTDYKTANSKIGYNGLINKDNEGNQTERLSTQTSCLKFYAFNDDGGNKLNLLLDHNTTKTVAWTNSTITTNKEGPIDLKFQLYNDTKDWNGTVTPLNYTIDQRDQGSETYYTIEYNKIPLYEGATKAYKARLLTAQEIAIITGNVNWNEKTSFNGFYFDSNSTSSSSTCYNGNTTGCKYGWIYTRTNRYCGNYGCSNSSESNDIRGYWLASSVSKYDIYARIVSFQGDMRNEPVTTANYFGVRPVIEVLKSKL